MMHDLFQEEFQSVSNDMHFFFGFKTVLAFSID